MQTALTGSEDWGKWVCWEVWMPGVARAWWHGEMSTAWAPLGDHINRRGTLKPFWLHNYWHCLITDLELGEKKLTRYSSSRYYQRNPFLLSCPDISSCCHLWCRSLAYTSASTLPRHHFIPPLEAACGSCPPHSTSALPLGAYCLHLWLGAFCLLALLLPSKSTKKYNLWIKSK